MRADPDNSFSRPNNSIIQNNKWDKDESEEDDFDKLIGHIEGSK